MKKYTIITLLLLSTLGAFAQSDTIEGTFWNPKLRNYEVKQAFEVESLVPMFITGGYHLAVSYRYERFRVRASVINGGNYNEEPSGINNSSANFKRYYKTSPGIFFGYNIWKNLEVFTFIEAHTFEIEQKISGVKKDIHSSDFGSGINYQFFIGRYFYIQPGLHIYLRTDKSLAFDAMQYNIPNIDIGPVLRVGARLWKKY